MRDPRLDVALRNLRRSAALIARVDPQALTPPCERSKLAPRSRQSAMLAPVVHSMPCGLRRLPAILTTFKVNVAAELAALSPSPPALKSLARFWRSSDEPD
jgi:hypothetical protein